ncbi:MAG TPA: tetratricopeptide repeat protein [Kofleriaceae bacterium]|jgi:tetratricopeptide (TPR) repeat protein
MRAVIAICLVALVGASASAHPDRAAIAYREGRRLYDLRDWDAAIAKFKEAYELRADAASLYDIAQAYRLKGDCVEAASFYRTYMRNFPASKNHALVTKFLGQLEPCVQAATQPKEPPPEPAPAPVVAPPAPVVPSQSVAATPPSPAVHRNHTALYVGLAAVAVGAVAGGWSIHESLDARAASNDVSSGNGAWDPNLQARGQRDDRNAVLFAVGGGAALVGGVVAIWLGLRSPDERPPPVAVTIGRGVAGAAWSCAF